MPTLNDIRSAFLNYYAKQGHQIVPSSPLVPRNDPTLMFVNSGMVQFRTFSQALKLGITVVRSPHRNVSGPAANTMTWIMWATQLATIHSLK